MTVSDFFNRLLQSQKLTPDQLSELSDHREEVEKVLRKKFGDEPKIRYAGSKAKGTIISDSYDLDIVCYFPNDCGMTIKEIYYEVWDALEDDFTIEPKTSALRIKSLNSMGSSVDYHIDVVPGRFMEEGKDVFLYLASANKERIQTNLKTHIDHIKDSEQQEVIKFIKLWNTRNNLNLRTFVLELLVARALKGVKISDTPTKVQKVLTFIRDEVTQVRLEDPANSNNVVTDLLTLSDKMLASSAAGEAIRKLEESEKEDEKVRAWQDIFKEDNIGKEAGYTPPLIVSNEPFKPWSNA